MDYIVIGKRIKAIRIEREMTQEAVSVLAKISLSFFGHIERGNRKSSIDTIEKIANALNVSMGQILDDDADKITADFQVIMNSITQIEKEFEIMKQKILVFLH